MLAVLLFSRIVLCGIFLAAGLSKLRDLAGSRRSLLDFGVPEALAKPFSVLLPIAEVLVAVGFLLASFAWISAVGALGLLVLFIIGITVTLTRGKKPDCHCFGQLHSKPIGWDLVGRNAVLAIVAGIVIQAGPRQPRLWASMSSFSLSSGGSMIFTFGLAIIALLILQSWLIFQLIQQGGRVLLRLDALEKQSGASPEVQAPAPQGLPIGDPAPEFELPDLEGNSVSLAQLRRDSRPVILLFTHPGCGPCSALLPEAAAWQRDSAAHFRLALITQGTRDDNRDKVQEHEIHTVLLQREHEVSDHYDAVGTPSAVAVRPDGVIGSPVATGAEAIRTLVSSTINESLAGLVSIQLQEGATAPPLVFPDLDGRMSKLSELRGKPTALFFWNPGCGFCQQMLPDVKAWEKKVSKGAPQLVVISTGTVEENRKQGFRSRVLLDQNFSAGKAFGVGGTPSALLLDTEGKVISKVAVGKEEIRDSIFSAQIPADSRA